MPLTIIDSFVLTSWNIVNLVLKEEVNERNKTAEERAGQYPPIFDCYRVRRTERKASQCPRYGRNQIADHEDVVPIMVIR